MVMEHFKGNVAAMTQWYATPVEELEDNTPNGLLLSGKDAKLYNYVINTLM